jgi:hypothetical protein
VSCVLPAMSRIHLLLHLLLQVGLLSYRYKFGPPVQQPKAGQRFMQQVRTESC